MLPYVTFTFTCWQYEKKIKNEKLLQMYGQS